ncbi:MAG: hypothetical protein HQL83_16110 [Magnetococcales bacterium]|nr:hypothetical protein [Magnetococcales bacterium]
MLWALLRGECSEGRLSLAARRRRAKRLYIFGDFVVFSEERIVRVEWELRHQRELMKQGFDQVGKHFEQFDKHFGRIDKRFDQVGKHFEQFGCRLGTRFEGVIRRLDRFMIWSFGVGHGSWE